MYGMYNYKPADKPRWLMFCGIALVTLVLFSLLGVYLERQFDGIQRTLDRCGGCVMRHTSSTTQAPAPVLAVKAVDGNVATSTLQKIEYYSEKWDVSFADMIAVIKCESNFRHENVYGDGGRAYGLCQFHKPTFDDNCEKCNYYSIDDQIDTMAKMFSLGLQHHWTCYKKLFN